MYTNIITIVFIALTLTGCRDDRGRDGTAKKVEIAQTPVVRKKESVKAIKVNSEKSVNSIDDFIYSEVFPNYRGEGYITYFDLNEEDCKSGKHKFVTLYVDGSVHYDKLISKKINPYYEYKNEEAGIDLVESACQIRLSLAGETSSKPLVVFMDVESVDRGSTSHWEKKMSITNKIKQVVLSSKYLKTESSEFYNCGDYFKLYKGDIVGGLVKDEYFLKFEKECSVHTFEKNMAVVCSAAGYVFVYQDDVHVVCSDTIIEPTHPLNNAVWGSIFVNGVKYYMSYYYLTGHPKKAGYRFVPADKPVGYAGKRALGQYYIIRVPNLNVEKVSR